MAPTRRWTLVVVVLAAVAAAAAYGARAWPHWRAQLHYRAAVPLLEQGRADEARAALRAALDRDVRHCAARAALAQLELAAPRIEHAFLEFQALTELCPADAAGWLGLGRSWLAAGLAASAEGAATRALELQPTAEAHLLRARSRMALARHEGAAFDAWRALALAPGNAEAAALLAQARAVPTPAAPAAPPAAAERFWPGRLGEIVREVLQAMRQRQFGRAREIVDAAGRDFPRTMVAPWLAGIVAYQQGQFADAERQLRIALAVAPRSSRVVTNLAGAWAKQHGPEQAALRLLELQERDPEFVVPLDIAATGFIEARAPARAEEGLRRGTALPQPPVAAFRFLAGYYRHMDRLADAIATCRAGRERHTASLELLRLCAELALEANDTAGAVRELEALLATGPDPRAAAALARLLLQPQADAPLRERLRALVQAAQRDTPHDADTLDGIGWVRLALDGARAARPWLAAAVAADPGRPDLRYHHAVALAQIPERAAARAELAQALAAPQPFRERPDAQRLLTELGG